VSEPVRRELTIPNETQYLAAVREGVREVVTLGRFPEKELNKLTLAVDEAVTNVMEHAYEYDLEGEMHIQVVLEANDTQFVACIRDWGKAFDPTAVPTPDLTRHVAEGRRHGLGIFLIRQIMDEVSYRSTPEGCNELRLLKRAKASERDVRGAVAVRGGRGL